MHHSKMQFFALCSLLFALPQSGAAQDSIVVRAGGVIDGKGGRSGPSDIVIRGSKIAAIRAPAGRPTYDLSRFTVMPGGIDTHIHLTLHFDANGRAHGFGADPRSSYQTPESAETP